jgi:hypothetical protein
MSLWTQWQEDWLLYHKVTINGADKTISVNPNVTSLDIRADVYSTWKEWSQLRDNTKFLQAIRTTGGDPIGGGAFTGDVYFLINGWKLLVDVKLTAVTGVLFSDNYDTAYYDLDTKLAVYPARVSSIVNTYQPTITVNAGDITVPTVSDIWSFANRTLTSTPTYNGPSAEAIRIEMDTSSTKLQDLLSHSWTNDEKAQIRNRLGIDGTSALPIATPTLGTLAKQIEIQNELGNISVSSSALNAPAISFSLTSGIVTSGSFTDTRSINSSEHVISDNAGAFDVKYTFDIGINAKPSLLTFAGRVTDQHETVHVSAWNYTTSTWDNVGTVTGSKSTNTVYSFALYPDHTSSVAGTIGDVQIRFNSTIISDLVLHVDQLYVSYATLEAAIGYSAHAVSATASSITLPSDASNIDNYYVPCLITVNHGTGANQYAKALSYNGNTRTLQLELPMVVTLDSSSHITLSPWASTKLESGERAAIADEVRVELTPELTHVMTLENNPGLTPTQATMLLELYAIMGLDPLKPLVVTQTQRTAGSGITQTINTNTTATAVTRV